MGWLGLFIIKWVRLGMDNGLIANWIISLINPNPPF